MVLAVFSARLDEAELRWFDALAAGEGGRSALLRRLVARQLADDGRQFDPPDDTEPRSRTVRVHLSPVELAVIEEHAKALSLTKARWISVLVRRRIGIGGRLDPEWRTLLIDIRRQLRGVARNLNQATRATNAAAMPESGIDIGRELARIAEMRDEIVGLVAAMDEALRGDYRYWRVGE